MVEVYQVAGLSLQLLSLLLLSALLLVLFLLLLSLLLPPGWRYLYSTRYRLQELRKVALADAVDGEAVLAGVSSVTALQNRAVAVLRMGSDKGFLFEHANGPLPCSTSCFPIGKHVK